MSSLFPTSYFGNINYFKTLASERNILIEGKEHFPKQTYRNRFEIISSNGVQSLSIPVNKINGTKTLTEDVEISYLGDWRKDHWKAIESAYSSSPYFEHYGVEVNELIYQNETNLLKFNQKIIERIINWLDIPSSINFTSEYTFSETKTNDFRDTLCSKKQNYNHHIVYTQVFENQKGFTENLSILDAIFCLGPIARKLII
jgi:hypothetical protein